MYAAFIDFTSQRIHLRSITFCSIQLSMCFIISIIIWHIVVEFSVFISFSLFYSLLLLLCFIFGIINDLFEVNAVDAHISHCVICYFSLNSISKNFFIQRKPKKKNNSFIVTIISVCLLLYVYVFFHFGFQLLTPSRAHVRSFFSTSITNIVNMD